MNNEKYIKENLSNMTISIHDINDEELDNYLKTFVNQNRCILKKVFNVFEIKKLSNFWIFSKLFGSEELQRDGIEYVPTRIKYSYRNIMIPYDLNEMMEFMLTKDFSEPGLFKKSPSRELEEKASEEFRQCLKTRTELNKALSKYDANVISAVFRRIFNYYRMSIIPKEYIEYFSRIKKLKHESQKRISLKFLLLCMPSKNLTTLEAVVKFIDIICELTNKSAKNHKEYMNLYGFTTVMMPNLMLKGNENLLVNNAIDLVDVLYIVFKDFKQLISIVQ